MVDGALKALGLFINNVELKVLAETAGVEKWGSAQHF
jgi:hypothetical protein